MLGDSELGLSIEIHSIKIEGEDSFFDEEQ